KAALPIWISYMQVALKDQPLRLPDPPPGMVKVVVGANGRLLPGGDGDGGIVEWIKAEDLQRMQEDALTEPEPQDSQQAPAEQAFDIF
ncbi:MAG: hypothetical protein ACK4MU_01910, partial [Thermomonas sp.]